MKYLRSGLLKERHCLRHAHVWEANVKLDRKRAVLRCKLNSFVSKHVDRSDPAKILIILSAV